jgi:hypothetical protein
MDLKAILTVIAILLGLPLLIVWLNDKIFHRGLSKKEQEEYSRRFEERLLNPDFAAVEALLGCALPEELKKLYANKDEIMRGNFDVQLKPTGDTNGVWSVGFYEPADKEAVAGEWPDRKQYFNFANDGCGNAYLIDPRVSKSEVLFHDHETGEFTRLGVNLDEFLSAPRKG